MTEIEFVDVNEWIEERYKKENNGLNFEEMVSGKDMRKKLWEIKVRETRGTYGENLKKRALAVREILLGTYVKEREISLYYSLDLENYKFKQLDLQSVFEQADDEEDFKKRLEEIKFKELKTWDKGEFFSKEISELNDSIKQKKKKLEENNFDSVEQREKIQKRCKEDEDRKEELEKKIDLIKWDYPYGKRKIFDSFTNVERDLYNKLLDLLMRIDGNEINSLEKAKKGEWEYFDIEDRKEILRLITKIREMDIWDISKKDFHDIQEKLIHPVEYRIKTKVELIFYWLQDTEISGDKEKIYEDLKKIDGKLKKILNKIEQEDNTSEVECREYLRQLILNFL